MIFFNNMVEMWFFKYGIFYPCHVGWMKYILWWKFCSTLVYKIIFKQSGSKCIMRQTNISSHNKFALYGKFKFQTFFPQIWWLLCIFSIKNHFVHFALDLFLVMLISNFAPKKALISICYKHLLKTCSLP